MDHLADGFRPVKVNGFRAAGERKATTPKPRPTLTREQTLLWPSSFDADGRPVGIFPPEPAPTEASRRQEYLDKTVIFKKPEGPELEHPRDRVMRAFEENGFLHPYHGLLCPTGVHKDHYWWSNGEYQERFDRPPILAVIDECGIPQCLSYPPCTPLWMLECLSLTEDEVYDILQEYLREPESHGPHTKQKELKDLWAELNRFEHSDLGIAQRFTSNWKHDLHWMLGNSEEPNGKGNYWVTYGENGLWTSDQEKARHLLAQSGERMAFVALQIMSLKQDPSGAKKAKKAKEVAEDDSAIQANKRQLQALRDVVKIGESLSGRRNSSVLPWAHQGLAVRPEDFDADPLLLNTPSGVVDLRDGTVREHRPELLMMKQTKASWKPTARAPRWQEFLDEMVPDEEVQEFLQEAAGLALTGEVDRRSKLVVLYGDGSNGKSVFTNVLRRVLGNYGFEGSPTVLQPHKSVPTDLYDLWGPRFVAINELEDEATELADAKVKQLTSEEPIPARRMFRDFVYFRATAHVFLKTNHFPIVKGRDHGIWSRIEIVRWDNKPRHTIDKLADLLVNQESAGILAWAWAGLQRVQAQGEIFVPTVVSAVKEAEKAEQRSTIEVFLQEECELDPTGWISTSDLQVEVLRFAKDRNQASSLPSTERGFGVGLKKALRSTGWFQEDDNSKPVQLKSNGSKRGYAGLSIKPMDSGLGY